MARFRHKKHPPLKSFTVRYLLRPEIEEYPREIPVMAKNKGHAERIFTSQMNYDVDFKIISIS